MNRYLAGIYGWFSWAGSALSARLGRQSGLPASTLVDGSRNVSVDGALQLSAVWGCIELLASTIASLPLFVYASVNGVRTLARDELLWQILHDSPNSRMTPMEFWTAMLLNLLFRGNAYARVERNASGDAFALWPMPADQVEVRVLKDGSMVYLYRLDNDVAVLAPESVLHLKGMGNGVVGLSRLDYMRATTTEAAYAQAEATRLFASGGKPSGVLMVDKVLKPDQRKAIKDNFSEMADGTTDRLHVLEAEMKYQQINLTPEQQQLLQTREYGVEEICRWFRVPPVLIGHSNVTTWGTGVEQIIDGFYKLVIRPALVNLEQALRKRVMSPAQRSRLTSEFSLDALLRASLKDRVEIYAKKVQNGLNSRNECRQLENDPPVPGGDELTAQSNLVPLSMLGKIVKPGVGNASQENTVAQ